MILEHAVLNVKMGQAADFETDFNRAQKIISQMPGILNIACSGTMKLKINICYWSSGSGLRIIQKGFGNQKRTANGGRCCIIITSPFPQ